MHVKKTVVFLLNSAALIALANSPVVYAQAAGSGGTGAATTTGTAAGSAAVFCGWRLVSPLGSVAIPGVEVRLLRAPY
jgi:hypothetical protein